MGEITKIEWTDHTFNPWIGCSNVSPGCDNCYAESMNKFRGWTEWGPHGKRNRTSESNWKKPLTWNKSGKSQMVFCASLADVFDNKSPVGAREDLWSLIRETTNLQWQLLTKRPQNIRKYMPADWGEEGYQNVWLGITTENQTEFDRRWKILQDIPAPIRFISYEPAIGPVRIPPSLETVPDWVIFGGESGHTTRLAKADWARCILGDCRQRNIAFFLKQWGDYKSNPLVTEHGYTVMDAKHEDVPENGKGGGLLDGLLYREFPDYQEVLKTENLFD